MNNTVEIYKNEKQRRCGNKKHKNEKRKKKRMSRLNFKRKIKNKWRHQ